MAKDYRYEVSWKGICYSVGYQLKNWFDKIHYYSLLKIDSGGIIPSEEELDEKGIITVGPEEIDEITKEISTLDTKYGIKLAYRYSQEEYATAVMDAIKDGNILLIEGGVGTGKTYGYLLPIVMTMEKSRKFKKVIIAAPTIALQEQLIQDIRRIEKMLGIEIKACIAKGINNYACIDKIESELLSPKTDPEVSKILMRLKREILKKSSSDKAELMELSKEVWDKVKLSSRGACSNCNYTSTCPYYKLNEDLPDYNLIVTNHGNYIRNVLDDAPWAIDADAVVIDEVHQFYDNVLSIREQGLSLDYINKLLDNISEMLPKHGMRALKMSISQIFSRARASGSANFFSMNEKRNSKDNYSIVDSNRLRFDITKTVAEWLDIAIEQIENLLSVMKTVYFGCFNRAKKTKNTETSKIYSAKAERLEKLQREIEKIYVVFKDMRLSYSPYKKRNLEKQESKNIYWAFFYEENKIIIRYTPKDNMDLSNKIFSGNIPFVLTSATMGIYYGPEKKQQDFKPIVDALGLNNIDRSADVRYANAFSPYEYNEQVSFYYDPNMSEPNESDEYIIELASKIDEAIRITEGKALILFTSKKTMYRVYKYININYKYAFRLLLHEDNNANEVKEDFAKDINSCLFATGVFWEGIDIKGPALSNLIITHLPFEQVDAINEYQASKYSTERQKMQEVYLPKMLLKFKQGFGRLIRSENDRGILVCLDPRISRYLLEISETTQITMHNLRTNIAYPNLFYEYVIAPRLEGKSKDELDRLWTEYSIAEYKLSLVLESSEEEKPKPPGK